MSFLKRLSEYKYTILEKMISRERVIQILLFVSTIVSIELAVYSYDKASEAKLDAKKSIMKIISLENDLNILRLSMIVKHSIKDLGKDDFQNAVRIRNDVYQYIPIEKTSKDFDFREYDIAYLESLRNMEVGHFCKGISKVYEAALESQGIPARHIDIYSNDKVPYDAHATTEFWYNGKWYAADATFNIMFRSNGEYLSYQGLYEVIQSGGTYEVVSNGYPLLPSRSIETYYISMKDLMQKIVIFPSKIWSEGNITESKMQFIPKSWNGVIQKVIDYKKDGVVDDYLLSGPLR